jgi:hypothetical protein
VCAILCAFGVFETLKLGLEPFVHRDVHIAIQLDEEREQHQRALHAVNER